MVAKKRLSKRLSCSVKYKIARKVREHHRKARKSAKDFAQSGKKLKKDPGIPNLFPGKDKLLTAIQDFKAAAAVEKRNGPAHVVPPPSSGLADLRADAEKRGSTFDAVRIQIGLDTATYKSAGDAAVDGTKDNSFRAYKHHFAKLVSLSDVILFVLDARDPLGTRAKQVEETILNAGASKKIILVLNKIDLVPQDVVKKWLKYLREEFPTVGFKSSTKENSRIAHIKGDVSDISESALKTSEAVGAETLLQLLKNYARISSSKCRSITVGILGFPNVGKSSLINSLVRHRACSTGNSPGLTKDLQVIALDKGVKLVDCPGIVFAKGGVESVLRNCVKVELIADPIVVVEAILERCPPQHLQDLYRIPPWVTGDVQDFLIQVARVKGKLKKGGRPDLSSAARAILYDWSANRIPFYTLPPTRKDTLSSSIVEDFGAALDLDAELAQVKDDSKKWVKMVTGVESTAIRESEDEIDEEEDDDESMDEDSESEMNSDEDFEVPEALMSEDEDSAPAAWTGESMEVEGDENDSDDDSEEEVIETKQNLLRVAPIKRKKKGDQPDKPVIPMTEFETLINPQLNQQRKKALKKTKKREEKGKRVLTATDLRWNANAMDVEGGDEGMDETPQRYNFAEFYGEETL